MGILSRLSVFILLVFSASVSTRGFQSDELLVDDEEFVLVNGRLEDPSLSNPLFSPDQSISGGRAVNFRSDAGTDSKLQFSLEHSFGESEFSPAGLFSARVRTLHNGAQTLTKLRFSRNGFADTEKDQFKKLLENDDFYRIRLASDVLSPSVKSLIMSSVKARCLVKDDILEEHITIHTEGVHLLAVSYTSLSPCPYPRPHNLPAEWAFKSVTILKSSEQAPRTPLFLEEIQGEASEQGVGPQAPERSFWAKYWMYLIPLVLVVMNVLTQAMSMSEEQSAAGAGAPQAASTVSQRSAASTRRR